MSVNRVVLIGRLVRDVELRVTGTGTQVVSFTIAVDNQYQSKDSKERTASFINCVAWQQTAKLIADYLHKGSLVGIEGRLQTRSYDSKDGRKVTVTEVVCDNVQFLSPKSEGQTSSPYNAPSSNDEGITFSDEDLPF